MSSRVLQYCFGSLLVAGPPGPLLPPPVQTPQAPGHLTRIRNAKEGEGERGWGKGRGDGGRRGLRLV